MRIILQREVDKLGVPGDVIDVADGYARNYLIPRGMAAPAVKGAVRHAERLREGHRHRVERALAAARELAERLTSSPIRMRAKAGEGGKLFGRLTLADLARELEARAGAPLDRHAISIAAPIRSVGAHEVTVHLHPDVAAVVTVEVVPG